MPPVSAMRFKKNSLQWAGDAERRSWPPGDRHRWPTVTDRTAASGASSKSRHLAVEIHRGTSGCEGCAAGDRSAPGRGDEIIGRECRKSRQRASKGQIANGAYDQIKVKLVEAEAAVAAVQRRLSEAETQQAKIEKIAQSAPGVLVQAQDLDRDYGVLKRNYTELVARRESTQIANAADTETEKIQFRIVDPPQVPVVPAAPNRPLLVTIVLALGVGAGLVAPLLVMQLDRSFATLGQLRNLGIPILGSVSRLSIGAAQRRAALQFVGVTASALILVAVYGTLLMLSIGLHSVGVS